MTEQLDRLTAALADRYTIERELGVGGMATVGGSGFGEVTESPQVVNLVCDDHDCAIVFTRVGSDMLERT